jgi:hypothetical protein
LEWLDGTGKKEIVVTPSALYSALKGLAVEHNVDRAKLFPNAPHILTRRLKELKVNLEEVGWKMVLDRVGEEGRRVFKFGFEQKNDTDATDAKKMENGQKRGEIILQTDDTDATDATSPLLRSKKEKRGDIESTENSVRSDSSVSEIQSKILQHLQEYDEFPFVAEDFSRQRGLAGKYLRALRGLSSQGLVFERSPGKWVKK